MDEAMEPEFMHELAQITPKLALIAEQHPSHAVVLAALLATFQAVAMTNPCCTRRAAEAALKAGAQLLAFGSDGIASSRTTH